MATLLIVHHTPSPAVQEMFEAVVRGARTDEIGGVEVVIRPALTAAAADVLGADGYLLGTPANIGYMSGALKHFFDGIYYPCLEATQRRPYGLYVHGGMDTGGAVRAVESITTGLRWRAVRPPVCVTGAPGKPDLEA
ncbi:MAG TPA: NAD(P)H-dependent oxidoreductase [Streptosporangiaceae bacterium]|jgi:multimeric flavodoxin WrbA|nr:NAD(P)H-dependent oxidoreductase [Streptosporangiaceae bacterium]